MRATQQQQDIVITNGISMIGTYLAPMVIVALCVAILQYHSIIFWGNMAGDTIGWLWSVAVEVIGLWFWLQKSGHHRRLGFIASIILLAGPLFLLGADLIHHQELAGKTKIVQEQMVHDEQERRTERKMMFIEQEQVLLSAIDENAKSIATYRNNSMKESQRGWSKAINTVMEQNAQIRSELNTLYADRDKWRQGNLAKDDELRAKQTKVAESLVSKNDENKLSFLTYDMDERAMYFLVGLQMLALILLQTANVIAMIRIGNVTRAHQQHFATRKAADNDMDTPSYNSGEKAMLQPQRLQVASGVATQTASEVATTNEAATTPDETEKLQHVATSRKPLLRNNKTKVATEDYMQVASEVATQTATEVATTNKDANDVATTPREPEKLQHVAVRKSDEKLVAKALAITSAIDRVMSEQNWSLKEIAEKASVPYHSIAVVRGYQSGSKRKPSLKSMDKIQAFLDDIPHVV